MALTKNFAQLTFVKHCCIFVVFVFRISFAAELDFTIEVPPGRMQCLFQEITEDHSSSMQIDYQVINGGDLNINFLLADPNGRVIGQDIKRTNNIHKVDVSVAKGDYQLCFDNTFSYQTSKIVYFQIFIFDKQGSSDDLDYSKLTGITASDDGGLKRMMEEIGLTVDAFKETVVQIKNKLNQAEHFQSLLRAFELRDRSIMEANFERVNFWSVINLVVMILVCLIQVYMIRSLFEDRSKIGKLLRHNK